MNDLPETPAYDRMFKQFCPACASEDITIMHRTASEITEHYSVICHDPACLVISSVTEKIKN